MKKFIIYAPLGSFFNDYLFNTPLYDYIGKTTNSACYMYIGALDPECKLHQLLADFKLKDCTVYYLDLATQIQLHVYKD